MSADLVPVRSSSPTDEDHFHLATAPAMVMPLVTAEQARMAVAAYEDLKRAIIRPDDLQRIGTRDYIKKSGWLRIARAFGLTVEPTSERFETADDGSWGYAIVVRALAPNGASMQGDGMCWSSEKQGNQRTRHNVRAHAYTRATNRAISNLVGGGEVSAEEITADGETSALPSLQDILHRASVLRVPVAQLRELRRKAHDDPQVMSAALDRFERNAKAASATTVEAAPMAASGHDSPSDPAAAPPANDDDPHDAPPTGEQLAEMEWLCTLLDLPEPHPDTREQAELNLRSLRRKARDAGHEIDGDDGGQGESDAPVEHDLHELGTGKAARH